MFLLRRAATRALSATPPKPLFSQPRSLSTVTPCAFQTRQNRCSIASIQKRFASDEVVKPGAAQNVAATEEQQPEVNFAQTAAEAPLDDGLTPVQERTYTEPATQEPAPSAPAPTEARRPTARKPRAPQYDRGVIAPNKSVYVGNLFYEVTGDQLMGIFSRFGEIENTRVIYDHRGISKGFGYVDFKNIDDAQNAINNLDQQEFEGRTLRVQFYQPKSPSTVTRGVFDFVPQSPSSTLFIGNLSYEISDKDLNDLFRTIHNVTAVRVAIDRRTGQPRGFAHADFANVESAIKAKEQLKDKVIYGRPLRIDFSKPQSSGSTGRRRQDRPLE